MGGYLVCVETKEEANFVFRLARPVISDAAWCWVGATDEQSEGDFRWINGSPFVNVAWWPPQPDNRGGSENYVVIAPKGFNDANAEKLSVFVCEWEN